MPPICSAPVSSNVRPRNPMDAVLKAFSIGFLLRSLFAGVFFVISYRVAGEGITVLQRIDPGALFSVGLPVAIFAGVTIYSMHRSLIYPFLEYWLNSEAMERLRRRKPLVSKSTIRTLRSLWCTGLDKDKAAESVARHTSTWADYTHLQYTSALCIAAGSVARKLTDPGHYDWDGLLLALTVSFLVAAITSDWRLHAVRERLADGEA